MGHHKKGKKKCQPSPICLQAGSIRIVHNVLDAPNVDVFIDGQKVVSDLAYGQSSNYLKVSAGPHRVKITAVGDPLEVLIRQNVKIRPDTLNTAIISGSASDLENLRLLMRTHVC